MNVIFQIVQNLLRRGDRPDRCPHCGKPVPRDVPDMPDGRAPPCPSCGRPPTRDERP